MPLCLKVLRLIPYQEDFFQGNGWRVCSTSLFLDPIPDAHFRFALFCSLGGALLLTCYAETWDWLQLTPSESEVNKKQLSNFNFHIIIHNLFLLTSDKHSVSLSLSLSPENKEMIMYSQTKNKAACYSILTWKIKPIINDCYQLVFVHMIKHVHKRHRT